MPVGDNIIAQTQAQTRSLSGWLGGKERLEDLVQIFLRNSIAVVPDNNFSNVA